MKTHTEYLTQVLKQWGEFCKSHSRFETAIKDILAENERLKAENEEKQELIAYLQNANVQGLRRTTEIVKTNAKTEAYKEFFKLVHKELTNISNGYFESNHLNACEVLQGAIDKLRETYKEMVGEDNE